MDLNTKAGFKESEYVGMIKEREKQAKLERKYSIGRAKPEKLKSPSACVKFWVIVATILMLSVWFLRGWLAVMDSERALQHHQFPYPPPPPLVKRIYENNGYLMVSCNGGLNQMRTGICDMVAVARFLNLTLIVPELDRQSYWSDNSEFAEVFDVDHFITSLRDEVCILKELPPEQNRKAKLESVYPMYPLVFGSLRYYLNRVLPRIRRHEIVHFTMTDFRLANNGLPEELQKLRCRVNFRALKHTPTIEEKGRKIVRILRQRGPFLVLNLRYEKDILAFTGCTEGCSDREIKELTDMRYAFPHWKHFKIDAKRSRRSGSCPLTPEETALLLQALGIDRNIQIYIASGNVYGTARRMENLTAAYPNLVRKETILEPSDLRPFQNHSNQMAALDFIVAVESDTFIPTYGGNMAKVVEGHRRYLGFKKTILPNRELLVDLIDQYKNGNLNWDEFSQLVKASHVDRMGQPKRRVEKPEYPRHEDYFYSNPQECLPPTIC